MKHKVCFLVIALMAIFAGAQAVERSGTITLKQEEIAEILAAKESYAYFGPEFCSLSSDLAALCTMASDAKLEAKHLAALHELAAQGYMTAPAAMVKAAVEEAALCIAACKANMTTEMARMAEALEAYDHALQTGAADVVVADAADDSSEDLSTRSTKRFDNIVVHNQADIGSLYVGGNTIINNNLTVNGTETIQGNLDVTRILAANGSVTAPSYSFINDTTVGLYLPGAGQLGIVASGTARIVIDPNGSVVEYSAYNAKAQKLTTAPQDLLATFTPIVFDNVIWDPNHNFNTIVYGAPRTGLYLVNSSLSVTSVGATAAPTIGLSVNGAAPTAYNQNIFHVSTTTAGQTTAFELNRLIRLTQGDTLVVEALSGNGSVGDFVNAGSVFDISFISAS